MNVHLTPELESFAKACVEGGGYNNVSEVVRDGLRMLQDTEERRRGFNAMRDAVREEAARDGIHELDGVLVEMDSIIAKNVPWSPPFLLPRRAATCSAPFSLSLATTPPPLGCYATVWRGRFGVWQSIRIVASRSRLLPNRLSGT